MSWQNYVDTNLVGSGKVTRAAIIGLQGGVWATSAGYTLAPDEQKALISALDNPVSTYGTGVRLGHQKFVVTRADGRSIYGKKQADGAVIVKTVQAVLVAEYDAPLQAGEATPIVEALADYLIAAGY